MNNPTIDVIIRTNWDVGAARCIVNPIIIIINGTNMTPPPIPNRLDMIPATKVAEKKRIFIHVDSNENEFPLNIDFLNMR